MTTFSNIAGAEPSTVTFRVGTVAIARGSTTEQQEILVLGDPTSSVAIAAVLATAPVTTDYGVVVRIASGPSSATDLGMRPVFSSTGADNPVVLAAGNSSVVVTSGNSSVIITAGNSSVTVSNQVRVSNSTATDLLVRPVFSSTSADNPVTVSGNSTVVVASGNSSVIITSGNSSVTVSNQVRVSNSTATDLLVRPVFSSTSADNPVVVSSVAGLVSVLATQPTDSTFVSGVTASSGDLSLISSAATRIYVYGYQLTIDSTTPTLVRLLSGSTTEMARWQFRAPSSVAMGANLAVELPGYLYRTAASVPLTLNTDSTAAVHYTFMAYRA